MFQALQSRLTEAFQELLTGTMQQFINVLPKMLVTIVILAVGVIIAHLAYKTVLKLSEVIGLDKLAAKVNIDRALKMIGLRMALSKILGLLIEWLIILFTLFLLAEILEFHAASDAVGAIVAYIPRLIIALLLLVLGLLLGRLLKDIVMHALRRTGTAASMTLGVLVQVVTVLFTCLLALRQIGFDVSIFTTNVAIIIAVLLGSAGLATALGLRPLLEQYFFTRYVKTLLRPGDVVRLKDIEGEVITITIAGIVLKNEAGETVLPARELCEGRFTKIRKSDS